MTLTSNAQENDIEALLRCEIKSNGIIIWEIESTSGHTYHVTIARGRVSSCERSDGEPCQGWKYRHSCHHATLAGMRELAYQDRKLATEKATMDVFAAEIKADRRHTAPLNGDRSFNLYR